ncbi:TPA: TIGR03747 family integrating conjugative element membrane protein [Salmonella enterica]|uniref:TIGR03747 family integrating conjugative element membrane protein n=1 Tax=Salmonella enterica TaxID=28901 RepID=UPI0009AF4738|nr:TIGR03747 family integrating conjugative element membrane protein [Salmonella enterica]HBD1844111.1 TIGR03747 family integrating conjugative element membrane protein [Salmonella enterica]
MAQPTTRDTPQERTVQRKRGLLYNLFWGWPWALIGVLLASLLLSLVIEYVGIAFIWPEEGAAHSERVMNTELGYLSTEFKRSLLMSEPSVTLATGINVVYQWVFVDSGFNAWAKSATQLQDGNEFSRQLGSWSSWLASYLHEYLMATVYVTVITLVRVVILVLSIPLFLLAAVVALVEGLGRRDLRRYGAAYESSFIYHHAKRTVKPALFIPCMVYLSWPGAIYPNLLLLPAAFLLGVAITVTTASFKKYL